ncbi:MAG: septum formation initiator family protein [Candidatus Omnitrophica bacterium]|nr:septum formation initiator family protein [Candidatus Omnitrophota bacterium]
MDGKRRRIASAKFWLVVAVFVIIFLPPFAKYQELKYKNKKLEERIEGLKRENAELTEEKRKLETDINYVEKKAREKIGVVRKGEIVMKEVNVRKSNK